MTGKVVGADDVKTNGSLRGARRKRERKITGEEALRMLREQSEKESAALAEERARLHEVAIKMAELSEEFYSLEKRELERLHANRRAAIRRVQTLEMAGQFDGSDEDGPLQSYPIQLPNKKIRMIRELARERGISIQRILRVGVELAVEYYGARA